ncbi:LOW QUALITY PROTEIN: hypothetical protein TorRG33x02_142340 [Trema orientale]|uniref:Uncharacterized protein n=1 Tax=Trema orientale TaxID=63057 RepID=A0A2P5EWN2_TREOI|nr:LOW QUALITY PROTEIN: hypothetical protein TorRG33x02_142340 [Trema orientale]
MSSKLLHFLSLAYFFNPISILWCSSFPFFFSSLLGSFSKASARHLAKMTPSSKAEQPPWPISGVIGWRASPATQTLLRLIFFRSSSKGFLYLSGDDKMLSNSVFSITALTLSGILPSLLNTNCFISPGFSSISFSINDFLKKKKKDVRRPCIS